MYAIFYFTLMTAVIPRPMSIVDRLSRNQALCQILVKLNNPWLSYRDLKVKNLGAVRHRGILTEVGFHNTATSWDHIASAYQISTHSGIASCYTPF